MFVAVTVHTAAQQIADFALSSWPETAGSFISGRKTGGRRRGVPGDAGGVGGVGGAGGCGAGGTGDALATGSAVFLWKGDGDQGVDVQFK